MNIILASGSPRRRELLEAIGLDFKIMTADTDESSVSHEGVPVGVYVQELALLKAADVAKLQLKNKKTLIIAADTVVTLDNEILGKPSDEEDAFDMLKRLSAREHEVYTGMCVMRISDGKTYCTSTATSVKFKELDDDTIRAYVKTGEPLDKAGAYGIQGKGAVLVEKIDGDYNNVVGMSTSVLADILKKEFDLDIFKEN